MKRRMLQNQYYPQNNNFMYPQYRQEQLNQVYANSYNSNCIFVKDRNEAEMWQIAPGNKLIFEDQNGINFYVKSLGFSPNDRPIFKVYKREDYVEPVNDNLQAEQNPLKDEFEKYQSSTKLEMDSLRSSIEELKELISQNSKPHFNPKKGGNR